MMWNGTRKVLHLQTFYRYGVPHHRITKQSNQLQQTIRNSLISSQQLPHRSLSSDKCIHQSYLLNILKQTPRGDSIARRYFSGFPADGKQKLEGISVVRDPLEEQWNSMFQLLEGYRKQKGDCNVPNRHIEDGKKLGYWLHRQRKLMKNDKLPVDRKQKLETLGVVWDPFEEQWNSIIQSLESYQLEEQWHSMFELLEGYQTQKGHCNVPNRHIEDGKKLGYWLDRQRKLMKNDKLPVDRKQKLEDIGVVWDPLEEQWMVMFDLFKSYRKQKGDCDVPYNHIEDGKKLGTWLNRQRKLKKNGKLTVDRRQKLETLGVVWDPLEEKWNGMFRLLESYRKQKGDCGVPSNYVEAGKRLGYWLDRQRKLMKNDKLPVDRKQKLEDIGVVWDPLEEQWNSMIQLLESLKKGDFDVPTNHVEEDKQLRKWLNKLRQLMKKGMLPIERQQKLETAGVVWDPLKEQWNVMCITINL